MSDSMNAELLDRIEELARKLGRIEAVVEELDELECMSISDVRNLRLKLRELLK